MKLQVIVVLLSVVVFVSSQEFGDTKENSASYSRNANQANYYGLSGRANAAQRRTFGDTLGSIISFIVTMIKRMLLINDTTRRSAAQRRSLDSIFDQIVSFIKVMIKRIFLITDAAPVRRSAQGVRRQKDDDDEYDEDDKKWIATLPPIKPGCKNGKCSFYVDQL